MPHPTSASPPVLPATPLPASAVPLLALAAFGSGLSLRVSDPLLPLLSSEFGVTLGDASLVITVFSIAYGLAQLGFGPLGDRYGKVRIIALGTLASAATAALCALAGSLPLLLAARLLAGATAAAIIPLSMAWIGDVIAYDRRQPVLARFMIGMICGSSAGVLLGGIAADHLQWRTPFLVIAAAYLVVGAGLLHLDRRLPEHARARRAIAGSAWRHMLAEFRFVLALPWARLVLLTVFLEGALLFGPFAFIATHLHTAFGISLGLAGAVLMLFGAGGFAFAMASALMVRRLGEAGLVRWGGALLALSLAAMGAMPVWWLAIPASFVAGLGFYMMHNTLQINATQMAPERRGAAVSAFASCFFMGQALGVGLAGLFVMRSSPAALLLAGAAGVLAVGLYFGRRLAQRPRASA